MLAMVSLRSPAVPCLAPSWHRIRGRQSPPPSNSRVASTAFRYVTPPGPTHDDEPIIQASHPVDTRTEPTPYCLSLNSEPGCIKVVDTFRLAPSGVTCDV